MNQSTTYNSAVEYHCIPHYQRIGPYLRKCMEDGQWSGEEPRCESKWTPSIQLIFNSLIPVIQFVLQYHNESYESTQQ